MQNTTTAPITPVYNLVILDKSGSMESIRKEAIDGYNETLGAIRAAQLKHMTLRGIMSPSRPSATAAST